MRDARIVHVGGDVGRARWICRGGWANFDSVIGEGKFDAIGFVGVFRDTVVL